MRRFALVSEIAARLVAAAIIVDVATLATKDFCSAFPALIGMGFAIVILSRSLQGRTPLRTWGRVVVTAAVAYATLLLMQRYEPILSLLGGFVLAIMIWKDG